MPEHEPRAEADDTPARARVDMIDLAAFLGVLAFAAGLALLLDRSGPLPVRLTFAATTGLILAAVTAWRRLRRPEQRRWRSGQIAYRGRRVTLVSAWGVEGQLPTALDPPTPNEQAADPAPKREPRHRRD